MNSSSSSSINASYKSYTPIPIRHDPCSPYFSDETRLGSLTTQQCYIIPSTPPQTTPSSSPQQQQLESDVTSDRILSLTCVYCTKSFHSNRLLTLHQSEVHDPFFFPSSLTSSFTTEPFACVLQHCDRTFKSCRSRDKHMVETHGFPTGYRLHLKNDEKRVMRRYKESLPGWGEGKLCRFYGTKGGCRMGGKCRFRHEDVGEKGDGGDSSDDCMEEEGGAEEGEDAEALVETIGKDEVMVDLCDAFEKTKVKVPDNITFGRRKRGGPRLRL